MKLKSSILLSGLALLLFGSIHAQPLIIDKSTYGWVKVQLNLPEFFVLVDGNIDNRELYSSGDSVKVPAGKHTLTIVGEYIHEYNTSIDLLPGETIVKKIFFTSFPLYPKNSFKTLKENVNIRIQTDPESEIFIDDRSVGSENAELFLPAGNHSLRIVHPDDGELTKKLKVNYTEIKTISRYNTPPHQVHLILKLLPGVGYLSQDRNTRALITYGLLAGLGSYISSLNKDYNSIKNNYFVSVRNYQRANSSDLALQYKAEAGKYLDDMTSVNNKIKIYTIGTLVLYGITTIDGLIKPKSGYRKGPQLNAGMNSFNSSPYSELTIKFSF